MKFNIDDIYDKILLNYSSDIAPLNKLHGKSLSLHYQLDKEIGGILICTIHAPLNKLRVYSRKASQ